MSDTEQKPVSEENEQQEKPAPAKKGFGRKRAPGESLYAYRKRRSGKKRGRPPTQSMPFEEAKKVVQAERIPSSKKYKEWWDREKPKALPRFPYRAYKEWVSWNDFLGTNNKFRVGRVKEYRSIEEATMWAHTLGLKTSTEWLEYIKTEGNLPLDVPARPDLSYKRWISWNHFLGNKPRQAIEAKQLSAPKTRIFYIIHHGQNMNVPGNVFSFGVEDGGIAMLRDRQERDKFEVVKIFWYDPDQQETIKKILDHFSTPYYGDERQRITPNIHEIIWHLQTVLETVITKR